MSSLLKAQLTNISIGFLLIALLGNGFQYVKQSKLKYQNSSYKAQVADLKAEILTIEKASLESRLRLKVEGDRASLEAVNQRLEAIEIINNRTKILNGRISNALSKINDECLSKPHPDDIMQYLRELDKQFREGG